MNFSFRFGPASIALASAVVATFCLSAFAFQAELSHFTAAGNTPTERVRNFADGSRQVGLSSLTQRQFMIDCRNAAIAAATMDLAPDVRSRLHAACRQGAEQSLRANPSSSFGWFALAHAALVQGDRSLLNASLERSQATGRSEGWIARYRVELVEDNIAWIDIEYLPAHRQDLETLMSNMLMYGPYVARIFARHPASREVITRYVEQLSPRQQRDFLAEVTRESRAISQPGDGS